MILYKALNSEKVINFSVVLPYGTKKMHKTTKNSFKLCHKILKTSQKSLKMFQFFETKYLKLSQKYVIKYF